MFAGDSCSRTESWEFSSIGDWVLSNRPWTFTSYFIWKLEFWVSRAYFCVFSSFTLFLLNTPESLRDDFSLLKTNPFFWVCKWRWAWAKDKAIISIYHGYYFYNKTIRSVKANSCHKSTMTGKRFWVSKDMFPDLFRCVIWVCYYWSYFSIIK